MGLWLRTGCRTASRPTASSARSAHGSPRPARAKLPALVILGEHDQLVPLAHAHAYTKGLPDARLAVLPGAGHYPYLEVPEAFAAEVERFGETARLQGASRG